MKLYFLCLLGVLEFVTATPAPQSNGGILSNPITSLFNMATVLPNMATKMVDNVVGEIPIIGAVPDIMEGVINKGRSMAKGIDEDLRGLTGSDPINDLGGMPDNINPNMVNNRVNPSNMNRHSPNGRSRDKMSPEARRAHAKKMIKNIAQAIADNDSHRNRHRNHRT